MASLGYFKKGSKLIPNSEDNSGGGSGGGGVLKATARADFVPSTQEITWGNCSHTGAELVAAFNNGIMPYLIVSLYVTGGNNLLQTIIAPLIAITSGDTVRFMYVNQSTQEIKTLTIPGDESNIYD